MVANITSNTKLAIKVGIPLVELSHVNGLDIVIDGADEFDPQFQLIKGGGAALLREKIVAQESSSMVEVVADKRKKVETLGAFLLPIEITPYVQLNNKKDFLHSRLPSKLSNVEIIRNHRQWQLHSRCTLWTEDY